MEAGGSALEVAPEAYLFLCRRHSVAKHVT